MRSGVCKLLRSLAISGIPLSPKVVKTYHQTIQKNLRHPNEEIQLDSKGCLQEFSKAYHSGHKGEANELVKELLKSAVTDENVAVTRGYTMAFGSFSECVLLENVGLGDFFKNRDTQTEPPRIV